MLSKDTNMNVSKGYKSGLPDGLDQLPPRNVLITVILTTVNGAEIRNRD